MFSLKWIVCYNAGCPWMVCIINTHPSVCASNEITLALRLDLHFEAVMKEWASSVYFIRIFVHKHLNLHTQQNWRLNPRPAGAALSSALCWSALRSVSVSLSVFQTYIDLLLSCRFGPQRSADPAFARYLCSYDSLSLSWGLLQVSSLSLSVSFQMSSLYSVIILSILWMSSLSCNAALGFMDLVICHVWLFVVSTSVGLQQ